MRLPPLPLLLLGIATASCDAGPGGPDRPDLVLVVIDTLRADHLGIYGHDRPTSPHLDALAASGVWFRRAYSQSGWTLPAMTSLLTGLLPHQHRVGRDPLEREKFGSLPAATTTLAEHLTAAGYRCGAIINNTFLAPGFGLQQGFADYDYRGASNEDIRSAEDSVDAALAWLAAGDARPAFLLLHLMEPHLNYDPPASVRGTFVGTVPPPVELPFTDPQRLARLQQGEETLTPEQLAYVIGLYDEEILAVDRAVGRFVDGLAARSRWPDTVLAITADHGEEFYDHGAFEHGHTLYAELTRVPLIVRSAGLRPGEVTAPVQHLDLFACLLARAHLPIPADCGGVDLFSLATGGVDSDRPLVAEGTLSGPPRAALTQGSLRVHVELQSGDTELWRLDANGREIERLGPAASADRRRLRQLLGKRRGSLQPLRSVAGPSMPDHEAFEQLKSLGYVR